MPLAGQERGRADGGCWRGHGSRDATVLPGPAMEEGSGIRPSRRVWWALTAEDREELINKVRGDEIGGRWSYMANMGDLAAFPRSGFRSRRLLRLLPGRRPRDFSRLARTGHWSRHRS